MAPRRRDPKRRNWPDNLYERKGYYSWRNPLDGREYGIGRDMREAFDEARAANAKIAEMVPARQLVDRVTGDAGRSVEAWVKKYSGMLDKQDYAENTRRTYKSLSKRMVATFGAGTPLRSITALQVSEGLERIAVAEGKARLAQAFRLFIRDSFREATVQGWIDANPVRDTKLSVTVEVKRARLSLEVYLQVYERSTRVWLRNAMDVALVSAQRRQDVVAALFTDCHDGGWWCEQLSEKSADPHRIFIPFDLRLNVLGKSLGDVISQCRRTGIVSKYLVHQTKAKGNSPLGSQIWIDTLSKAFSEELDALGIDWGEKAPPSYHEIRSLSERLYSAQGGVNTQELLGHKDAAMTATYHDPRGLDWVRISLG